MAESCDTRCKRATHVGIDKGKFSGFVVVLVVHVVDQVQRVHVDTCEPFEHHIVLVHHFVVVQHVARNRGKFRTDLHAGHQAAFFVLAAVDGVEESLGEVCAGAEELHFLTGLRCRNAAANAVVVTPNRAHHVVVFVLDRAGRHRDVGGIFLEVFRQALGVEDGEVGFRRRAHVFESVQETEVVLGDHRAAILAHTADFEGGPHRVAAEELVVRFDTGELDHAELHDHVVHKFLGFAFGKHAVLEVTFDINVEEGRDTANAHGGTVLRLDGREVAEVEPLEGFLCVDSRLRNVKAVASSHHLHGLEGPDLFGDFFAQANHVVGHGAVTHMGEVVLLLLDDVVNTVKGYAAVVTHDTATTVSVRKTGQQVGFADGADFRSVAVEYGLVVGLVVVGKDLVEVCARLVAVLLAGFLGHFDAAERHKGALQRLVGLQTHDLFQVLEAFADVARLMARNRRNDVGVHIEHAALLAFFGLQLLEFIPELFGGVCRACQKFLATFIGGVVALNEVADIDFFLPESAGKAIPCFAHVFLLCSTFQRHKFGLPRLSVACSN